MQQETNGAQDAAQAQVVNVKKPSQAKEIWRRFRKNRLAVIGLIILMLIVLSAVFAEQITPYTECITMNVREKLQKPSAEHWLGTDGYGRDLLARCLHGGRISLTIGVVSSLLSLLVGGLLGLVAGYYGKQTDNVIMRIMDMFSALPTILLALSIIAALGSSIPNLILALAISRVPAFVRIIRASVITIVDQEYVEAALAGGTSDLRIMLKHILPNSVGPLIVQTTMNVSNMILQAAAMSFLGLGVSPPTPEWGAIISEAKEALRIAPYFMLFPGIFIILSSLSLNLIGDGLRDALDPRLKT